GLSKSSQQKGSIRLRARLRRDIVLRNCQAEQKSINERARDAPVPPPSSEPAIVPATDQLTAFHACPRRHSGYTPLRYASRSPLGSMAESKIIGVMSTTCLTREEAVERLTAAEPEIRTLGVQRLALFGSVLRGEARPDSDIELLVQFSPGAKTFDHFLALFDLLEDRLGHRIELVTTEALSPFIGPRILAEAQDFFRAA
ncbi:MAG TPA: nucleotidyltransferase family protein, partial [Opitutaceae bacterium]